MRLAERGVLRAGYFMVLSRPRRGVPPALSGGGVEGVEVEEVHERVLVKGHGGEGEDENREGDDGEEDAAAVELRLEGHLGVTHGGDEEEEAPEQPTNPEESSGEEEQEGQDVGKDAVEFGGDGVEDVAAIELAAGDEVERGDEEADPSGYEHRVRGNVLEGRGLRIPVHEQGVDEADGEGFAAEADNGDGRVGGGLDAEGKAHGDGQRRGKIAGQGAVDADVHEGVEVGNAGADLDDGAGGSAERGGGQDPGQSGVNAMHTAGNVVAELVNQEDAEEGEGEGPAGDEEVGMVQEPTPGPQVAVADHWGHALDEVLHEASAVGRCGDHTGGKQKQRQAVLPE